MSAFALKEWAVTCEALAAGTQVLIVRKGGIGEKRFSLPHPVFYLFPTYAHQRPDLVKPEFQDDFGGALFQTDDPDRLPLALWAEMVDAVPITDQGALVALDPLHTLTQDYAEERLKWRRKHPLWAVILRVHRLDDPPVLEVTAEHGGCVSWIALPETIPAPAGGTPACDGGAFEAQRDAITTALAPFVAAG
ncbi:MAG: DUF1802 family protein [Thermoleophilia bacterium]|nr:DUF1802 family protein [Thermoleophilia bacterium]